MTTSPERCITCSDEAVEVTVVAVHGSEAIVRIPGGEQTVAIDLVPDAAPGDLLLCHAGIALERLEPAIAVPQAARSRAGRTAR
jgi:hydrogenase maturation factor